MMWSNSCALRKWATPPSDWCCYPRHSVKVRQPIKLAQTRLKEMRAIGLDPGHGGEAAVKRGAKLAESNRRRALHLSAHEMRERRTAQARARRAISGQDEKRQSSTAELRI